MQNVIYVIVFGMPKKHFVQLMDVLTNALQKCCETHSLKHVIKCISIQKTTPEKLSLKEAQCF